MIMKELSIEEKARAYDEALKVAEKYHNGTLKDVMETIFPELKESEDERIRKAIIEHFEGSHSSMYPYKGFIKEQILAWLERQGEQKPAEFDDTNAKRMFIKALERVEEQNNKGYKLTDCDKNSWWEDFKAYTSCIVEQKPWSEEDERLRTSCIKHIEEELERIRNDKYGHSEIISVLKESCRERINWLKSIKDKYTWKPSDEQIKVLEFFIPYVTECSVVLQKSKDTLSSLLSDLRKLREE